MARALHKKAVEAATADRYLVAIGLIRKGLALVDPPGGVDERLEVRTRLLNTLAFCLAETGSLEDGLAQMAAAREALADLTDPALRDELYSLVDGNRGVLLCRVGRIDEGIAQLDTDIAFNERRLAEATGDPSAIAELLVTGLSNRGMAHAYRTDQGPGPAIADLDRAVELAGRYGFQIREAIATHALGNVLQRAGDIPTALRRYTEAQRAFQDLEPGLLMRLRIDQSEALISVGLADEAGTLLDDVLPELRRQRIGQDVAEAELFRAAAALLDSDLVLAKRMANAAQRKLARRGSPAWAAVAGLIALRVDALKALDSHRPPAGVVDRALALAAELTELKLYDQAAFAQVLAARLEVRRGNTEHAERLLRDIPKSRRIAPIDHRMLLRLCRAELALAHGNQRVALAQAKAGLAELGRMRDRLGGLELVSGTALHGRELGELAVRLVLAGGDSATNARRLFTWLERTKAQLYRYEPFESTVDPVLAERITEVRQLSRALLRARLDGLPTAKLVARLATSQRDAMRLGWSASPWGKPRPVTTHDEVLARLGDRALVTFASSDNEMVAVVLAGGRVRMVRLGAADPITEAARRLHADLNALAPDYQPPALAQVIAASARREAERLDQALLQPLAAMIDDRELVVVPTGALYVVPWGVLPTCVNRPTVVAPSATAWLSSSREDAEPGSGVLLVRGPGLQAAQGEIDRLAGYHVDAKLLGVSDARVTAVLEALDGVALAHIAAHGEHEPENALFSKLELVDGALFAHEVGRMRRPPHRVVLAACELALNRVRPGDEPLGFAGALLAGGTRTVIAASSKVGDQPSAAAMADFHRNLAAGATPAVALADAVAVDPLRRPFVCLGSG
ncbi:tetratricopeptide (TPR) repeat protein [Saccharothrix tamanrassetensis]|uniref:Tetratricopeptide (TPR) repeat protein n=1 Tax=Saccharothrix tamanrassetensis TaxID=1051531 RepID=A0A841CH10_9PSEU|nr:CHAT domain-containing protein [Saccharothrix tamanrassetensis]MBB5955417.1 tetratricopeptide (TPR) repeat protein [Saccharothrix tamanrassetensis]